MTSIDDLHRRADEVRARLHPDGSPGLAVAASAARPGASSDPVLADWALANYADPSIELPTRALCTVAALVALDAGLYTENWMDNAMNLGVTREQQRGFASQAPAFTACDFPFWVCPGTSTWNSVARAKPDIR